MVRLLGRLLKDLVNQIWTLLGMFIAWTVLDGSAKTIVGYAILLALIIWVTTHSIRTKDHK
jgi:hypothetical protein